MLKKVIVLRLTSLGNKKVDIYIAISRQIKTLKEQQESLRDEFLADQKNEFWKGTKRALKKVTSIPKPKEQKSFTIEKLVGAGTKRL
jgi:hypothetical protein